MSTPQKNCNELLNHKKHCNKITIYYCNTRTKKSLNKRKNHKMIYKMNDARISLCMKSVCQQEQSNGNYIEPFKT